MLNFKHDRIATESWGDEGINRNWLKVMSIDKSKLNCYESEHDPRSWMKNLGGWKWKKKKKKKKFRLEQELNPGRNALSSELLEPIGDLGSVSRKSR